MHPLVTKAMPQRWKPSKNLARRVGPQKRNHKTKDLSYKIRGTIIWNLSRWKIINWLLNLLLCQTYIRIISVDYFSYRFQWKQSSGIYRRFVLCIIPVEYCLFARITILWIRTYVHPIFTSKTIFRTARITT